MYSKYIHGNYLHNHRQHQSQATTSHTILTPFRHLSYHSYTFTLTFIPFSPQQPSLILPPQFIILYTIHHSPPSPVQYLIQNPSLPNLEPQFRTQFCTQTFDQATYEGVGVSAEPGSRLSTHSNQKQTSTLNYKWWKAGAEDSMKRESGRSAVDGRERRAPGRQLAGGWLVDWLLYGAPTQAEVEV